MARNKKELSSLSIDELKKKVKDISEELFKLKLQHATGQLANTSAIKNARKNLARIKTFLTQKTTAK